MNQKNYKEIKIVLTGGHAGTTALAVTEELIRRSGARYVWDIYFVGTKRSLEGSVAPTIESEVLPKAGVKFHEIITGRIQRKFTFWSIPSLAQIPIGFLHAFIVLKKVKPHIILSFGAFASFPIVFVGWILRIPIVVHEQTAIYGRANKMSSIFAKIIVLARKSSLDFYPRKKTEIVGNPLLTQIANIEPKLEIGYPPTIYITGGSRGSVALNSLIEQILEALLNDYHIIHQTGYGDFKKFKKIRNSLKANYKISYEIYSVIDPMQVDGVFKRADIIVARAGANTVSDIIAAKRPALLIPLPIAYKDEQEINAHFAQNFGVAKVLSQKSLTSDILLTEINKTRKSWKEIVFKVKDKNSPDIGASKRLVDIVERILTS